MFFLISKILAFLIAPLVWITVLLLWSFITKQERRAKRLRIVSLIILYLCSNSFLVDEAFRLWEPVTPDWDLQDTHYQAAIVLGGIGDVDLRLQKINFGASADRLLQTLRLYHLGRVDKIIFTGGSGSVEFPEKKEGKFVHKYLREIQVPDSALIIESESRNTYENAVFSKTIIDSLQLHGNILLVTSGFHMRRSLAIFEKAGYTTIYPYVTNRSSGVRRWTIDHLFIPNAGALLGTDLLLHEWVGYLIYKLKGYA
jgi:uncharacterized SAM-binding protein YcdF (DUF218 family)